MEEYRPGLEGVIAAETSISYLDVEHEEIVIRGYDLLDLARQKTYVEVAALLLEGELPSPEEKERLERRLVEESKVPEKVWEILRLLPPESHGMDRLRTAVSALGNFTPHASEATPEADRKKGWHVLSQVAAIVANLQRIASNLKPRDLQPAMGFVENLLYIITGRPPEEEEIRAFDQLLIAYIEHEMPNSTFTARVIASTLSDLHGALTGAVASLKGPLHGGANEAVMEMFIEAGSPEGLERLIKEKLQRKERIMGFGHRVYMKKMDPRAQLMKETLARLVEKATGNRKAELTNWYETAVRGEEVMRQEKGLFPNLDYYAAPVYYALGIPIELYTPLFFASRTAGLVAHVIEQHAHNRLFRPRVRYTGPRGLKP